MQKYLPLIELPSRPELQVLRMGSETPLQRTDGEFGDEVGELGVDGPRRSAMRVEPAQGKKSGSFISSLIAICCYTILLQCAAKHV